MKFATFMARSRSKLGVNLHVYIAAIWTVPSQASYLDPIARLSLLLIGIKQWRRKRSGSWPPHFSKSGFPPAAHCR